MSMDAVVTLDVYECPTCKGEGEVLLKVNTIAIEGNSYEGLNITCVNCKGTGKVDQDTLDLLAAIDKMWCRCGGPPYPSTTYHEVAGDTDYVLCNNCRGTTQVG